MYGGGTREVVEAVCPKARQKSVGRAQRAEPAAAPDPMAGNGIDEQGNDDGVDKIALKFCPLRHGSGDDGGGGGAENRLEDEKGPVRVRHRGHRGGAHHAGNQLRAVHDAKADQPVDDGAADEIHQILHADVACVFCSGKAGLHHGEARLHEKDQRGPQQDP
ncbi:hypothetical protein SDC9_100044 [bioreactor metagenome]|uniref:Uncharacterized protein n=1 Tax=bioreactor metagenome TaxID=1076179 RepID=A0A645AJS3_9ZZZZ